jgi:ABC-type branched-subunit amino acid transport system ATPase component
VKSALKLSTRVYVIDNGRIRFEGSAADFEANEEIKKKYLMV